MKNKPDLDLDFIPVDDDEIDGYSDMSYGQSPFESQEDYEERIEDLNSLIEHWS